MKELTIILFERLGLMLIIAFVMTRTPGFRSLLYREFNASMMIVHACVFGVFGIFGTIAGVVVDGDIVAIQHFVWSVEDDQFVVSLSLVAIVIAGLLGGPLVGLGAGLIAGIHLFYLGGIGWLANGLVNPITGVLAGWTARFFSHERVISPFKALFIGVFPPILQMQLLLISYPEADETIKIVDSIGLPLVLSNCLAIAIFTAMIGVVLKEQENEAAAATRQALAIAEESLPFIKKGSQIETANGLADLLYKRLGLAAVSVASKTEILAHRGIGSDHHKAKDKIVTSIAIKALETKEMKVAYSKSEIECDNPRCPMEAGIIIPIVEGDEATWLIKFYFKKPQHIRPVEITLAQGLGQLMSNQLKMVAAENLSAHIKDAELRNLQAQINPHFLFNTLHLIAALFREDSEQARRITIQLAQYMRFNLRLVSKSLVDLEKEFDHVSAYVEIIQARFADRLHIILQQPDRVPDVKIPPSTIQPIVENCIQHGLRNTFVEGKVVIKVEEKEQELFFSICDNGCGFSEDMLLEVLDEPLTSNANGGTGLYNVNNRLISLLGEKARLHIRNLAEGGSEVAFTIPKLINAKEGIHS